MFTLFQFCLRLKQTFFRFKKHGFYWGLLAVFLEIWHIIVIMVIIIPGANCTFMIVKRVTGDDRQGQEWKKRNKN
jgi:hypothetical protein